MPRQKFDVTVTNWLREHRTSGHVLVLRHKSRKMSTSVSVTERRGSYVLWLWTQTVPRTCHEVRVCDGSVTFL